MLQRAIRGGLRGPATRRVVTGFITIALAGAGVLAAQEPAAPAQPNTHTVKRGDTLWDLAKLYLSDAFLWPEIYRLNTDAIDDPHWIYPGEVLKLPGEATGPVAAAPEAPAVQPERRGAPTIFAPKPPVMSADSTTTVAQAQHSTVRFGEYLAAPWVDQRGGPRNWGSIIQSAELSVLAAREERSDFGPYESVLISPPTGSAGAVHERYLAYTIGPLIEDLGEIMIPTGIVEVTRPPQNGEAAVGRIVKIFNQMSANQRLIPYDTSVMAIVGRPARITNGHAGRVRWIYRQPVVPGLQRYLVLDMSAREGVGLGDEIELYQPRKGPGEVGLLATPEISIARAQVVRVTPFAATAILTSIEQPKIGEGTAARVSAKMP